MQGPKARAKCSYVPVGAVVRVKCWSIAGFHIPHQLKLT